MNKFLGIYKTDTEYDWRECLILSYGIPLNNEFTSFNFEETLIVDLRSISQSVADYLRDLTQSTDTYRYKTFAEFALTRKYQNKEISVLEQLYNSGSTRKVPANSVKIKFVDSVMGEYAKTVEEINAIIQAELANNKNKSSSEEILPLTERVEREETIHGLYPPTTAQQPVSDTTVVDSKPSSNEIQELKGEIGVLKGMLEQLLQEKSTQKKPRKPKAVTPTTESNSDV